MKKLAIKYISCLLCMAMFLVALPFGYTASASEVSSEARMLLEALNIIDKDADENSIVTRAEFVKSVLALKDFDSKASADVPLFTDLSESHWAYHELVSASQLGYIKADNQGKIYPDSPADYTFSLQVIVDALNYKGIASSYGGDNGAYLKAANLLKLTDGISVSMGNPIGRDDFVKLMYNALFVPVSETFVKGDEVNFNSSGDKTILNTVHDIYYTTGVVTADKFITLGIDPYDAVKKFIVIGGVIYSAEGIDTSEIVGYNIKLYYEIDDNDNKKVICAIPKNNKVVTLENCEINYSNLRINATNRGEDNERYYNIGINTSIIWNYNIISEAEFASRLPALSGELKLIDNNSDGKYDVVIAENQTIVEVFGFDSDANILTGADGTIYDLEKYENVQFRTAENTIASPLVLQNARYVSVFAYENNLRNIVIRECKADIQTTLIGISASDSTVNLRDYGTLYISRRALLKPEELEAGQEYVFSFDCYGDIINVTTLNTGSNSLVYLIDIKHETRLNETFSALVLDLQGKTMKYEFAEKTSVRLKDGSEATLTYADLKGILSSRQPILIRLNTSGKINRILQLASADRDDLFFHEIDYLSGFPENERSSIEYQRSRLSFSNAIMLRNNAVKMFAVPHSEDADYNLEDFSVVTQAFFRSGNSYNIGKNDFRATAISMEADDFICDYMVWEYPDNMNKINSATISYGLIEKVLQSKDPNGDETGYLYKTNTKEFWMREKTDLNGNEIKVGSVIVYANDYIGRPSNRSVVVLCDLASETVYQQGSLGSYTKNDRFRVGKAVLLDKSGSVGKFLVTRAPGVTIVQCFNMSGKNISVYDKKSKSIRNESAVSMLQKGDEVVLGIAANALASIYMSK